MLCLKTANGKTLPTGILFLNVNRSEIRTPLHFSLESLIKSQPFKCRKFCGQLFIMFWVGNVAPSLGFFGMISWRLNLYPILN